MQEWLVESSGADRRGAVRWDAEGMGLTTGLGESRWWFVSALEILEHLSEASAEELALVKETAEELLSLQTADARERAEINAALAEAEADIAAGRLHSSEEIRRALGL